MLSKILYNRRLIQIFLIIGLAFSFYPSFPQSEIRFQHYSTRDGLSQNTINFIFQDNRGFIWIGTHDGLNKFDGNTFTVYKTDEDDPGSINSNDNYSAFQDNKGRLWFGTGRGISLYDPKKDSFTNFEYVHEGGYPLRPIWDIVAASDSNKLWLGASGGLFLFDIENESFEHHVIDESILGANAVQILLVDHKNSLWVGTNGGGLYNYNGKTNSFKSYKHSAGDKKSLSDNIIRSIYEDSDNNIWIGTNKGILNKFNYTDSSFIHYPIIKNQADGIFDILEDKWRNLWIGTDKEGLFQFDRKNEVFVPLQYKAEPGNNVIRSLYEDLKGNIWIGTYGGGVFLYDHLDHYFHFNIPYKTNTNNDQSNSVLAICESSDNSLWLGTDGGGLVLYDNNKNKNSYYRKEENSGLPGNTILSLEDANDNKLYIGTFLDGFSIYDIAQNKFKNFVNDPSDSQSISDNTIWDIYEEENGLVWLATNTGGLNLFNPKDESFKQFTYKATEANCLSDNSVRCIYRDTRNTLWVGTVYGLNALNPEDSTFTQYFHDPKEKNSLSNNLILCIYEDFSKNLWIGTHGGGLNKFDRNNGTFTHYKEKDGLPGNVVYGISEDKQGNLWISTDRGLSKFTPGNNAFKNFDESSGLVSEQFNIGSFYKNENGEMFFGSIMGVCYFNPGQIKQNYYVPPVYLTGFKIFNKEVGIGENSPLKEHISEVDTIFLDYKSSAVSFTFSALNFTHPKKNRYAYKLMPYEEEWNEVGNHNTATFTNLDPGTYTFVVKGSNNDGTWNENPQTVTLILAPPFWGTWWFRILMVLFFISIIGGAYYLNIRNIKKQKERLKELVELSTLEIKKKNDLLLAFEKQTAQMAREQLNNEIHHKNKELSKYTLLIIQKNRILEELKKRLREAVRDPKSNKIGDFKSIIRMINQNFSPEQEWAEFDANFNRLYTNFGETLKAKYPDLTHNDIRLCALFRLDIPTREIASVIGISQTSVKMARYRLRKKLNLDPKEDLCEFLKSYS